MKRIQTLTVILQLGLLIAGLTAFWIPEGVHFLANDTQLGQIIHQEQWLQHVNTGVQEINRSYPFIWYGTDWMVFCAHTVCAIVLWAIRQSDTEQVVGPIRLYGLCSYRTTSCYHGLYTPYTTDLANT